MIESRIFRLDQVNPSQDLPKHPGVYIFMDKSYKPLYIGKAKNLKARVSGYFAKNLLHPKTARMVESSKYLKIIPTASEVEAFLLEADLIKKFKPKYNVDLKDDKSYVHIIWEKINIDAPLIKTGTVGLKSQTSRESSKQNLVLDKVFVGRLTKLRSKRKVKAIGPFVEAKVTKQVLRALRRVFPFATCSKTKFLEHKKLGRPCLYGQIGLCPAPCIYPQALKANRDNIRRLFRFILKGRDQYTAEVEKKMRALSRQERFEEALKLRDHLDKLKSLELAYVLPSEYEENPNLIVDIREIRVSQILELFKLEKTKHLRIECYDISNLMGEWATGSMVVSIDGQLEPSEYRKFRIKFTKGITDFGMMAEVIKRRIKKDWPKPNIMLIDGGKGQVSSVLRAIQGTEFEDVLVVGIFKPNDFFVVNLENFKKATGKKLAGTGLATGWQVIVPKKRNLGWEHLRELRDEAHRTAKGYHKKLRSVRS